MYGKNDYRYYLENRLIHSDDYLAHERSHKYIKKIGKRYFYTQQELAAFLNKDRSNNASDMTTGVTRGIRNTLFGNSTIREAQNRGMKRTREYQVRELNRIGDEYSRKLDVIKKEYRSSKNYKPSSSTIEENVKQASKRGRKRTAQVKSQQTIKADQDRGRKRTEQLRGKSSEYIAEREANSRKNVMPKKRRTAKQTLSSIRRKYGLYREKPKGKDIGGGITVTHDTTIKTTRRR